MWDFVKNAVVDSLDAVPEKYRALYEKKGDKFEISDAAKAITTDYAGVIVALAKTKSDLTAANTESASRRVNGQAVADFAKSIGIENVNAENPLESVQTFVTEMIANNKKGGDLKVNLENIKREAQTRIDTVTTAANTEKAKMQRSLEKYMIGQAIATALASEKGNVEVLTPHIERFAKVVQDGEDYVVRVVEQDGKTIRYDGAAAPLSIPALVKEFKSNKTFAANFESEAAGGAGSKPGEGSQARRPAAAGGDSRSSNDKIAAGLKAMQGGKK